MRGLSYVSDAIYYVDANAWLYENGSLIGTTTASVNNARSCVGYTNDWVCTTGAYYNSNGSHYGQDYVLFQ